MEIKITSLKAVHGDEPSLATQPKPWDTQCKPLSAVKVICPLTPAIQQWVRKL